MSPLILKRPLSFKNHLMNCASSKREMRCTQELGERVDNNRERHMEYQKPASCASTVINFTEHLIYIRDQVR